MMNEQIKESLTILGFLNMIEIPKLKEVRHGFLVRAKELHPDKNIELDEKSTLEKEEELKRLLQAYKEVGEFILENCMKEQSQEDEEESRVRKEFNEMNFVEIKKKSIVIKIPTQHVDAWLCALEELFGNPIDRSVNNNGKQFKTVSGISITLWKKKASI